jgi:hypothetical protein
VSLWPGTAFGNRRSAFRMWPPPARAPRGRRQVVRRPDRKGGDQIIAFVEDRMATRSSCPALI